ncbi:hypothetical protein PybrP1_003593 [[Pythium] brassicae (nom. inval.)]|nr:hypothetical protein PybrP1_003593 [[Pythium] brassicae (nom. inval.)]
MATLGAASIVYSDVTMRLRDPHPPQQQQLQQQIGWCSPEAVVVHKPVERPEDDDGGSSDPDALERPQLGVDNSAAKANAVPVRAGRSQSLTDPTTPPMFATSTHSGSAQLVLTAEPEHEVGTVTPPPPLSAPESLLTTSAARAAANGDAVASSPEAAIGTLAPLVTPQQLASDPRFARRNRRSMSAEFTLSMLQQELGYPTRQSSRRDSVERRSRRASAATIPEEALSSGGDDDAPPSSRSSTVAIASSSSRRRREPEPERRSMARRHSVESATATSVQCRSSGSDCGAAKRMSYDDAAATTADEVSDDDDDDDDGDNFMDARVATVTGFSQDTDGVVYYEIIVRSVAHGPLSAYKVRRRYSEFRALHRALSAVMPASRTAPRLAALATNPLQESDDAATAAAAPPPGPDHHVLLPPLPDRGGLWAFLQFDTTPFLERRAQYFEALLVACQHHARARASRLLNDFLGPPPDAVARHSSLESSYVSLNRFAAPKLRLSVEAHERKQKARNISSRRRSSVHRAATDAITAGG